MINTWLNPLLNYSQFFSLAIVVIFLRISEITKFKSTEKNMRKQVSFIESCKTNNAMPLFAMVVKYVLVGSKQKHDY